MASQSVRKALDELRSAFKGKVSMLVLKDCTLQYAIPSVSPVKEPNVYPVSIETAREEAAFFGCEVIEQ